MTASEAIKIIKNYDIYGCGYCHQGGDEVEKAFDMAIKALEQEPCEDCISRQAVINAIANTCFWLSADNWTELMECIYSLPLVTPQLKAESEE